MFPDREEVKARKSSQEVTKLNHVKHRIWGRNTRNLGPKHARIWGRKIWGPISRCHVLARILFFD